MNNTVKREGLLAPSDYVQEQEHLVYLDGVQKNKEHLDWLTSDDRDLQHDLAALLRHLTEWANNPKNMDEDSGAHPLAHLRARAGIIMDVEKYREEA